MAICREERYKNEVQSLYTKHRPICVHRTKNAESLKTSLINGRSIYLLIKPRLHFQPTYLCNTASIPACLYSALFRPTTSSNPNT